MKLIITLLYAVAFAVSTQAQPVFFPTADAKSLGMGGVTLTTLSGSHAIYHNTAMSAFSRQRIQAAFSYYGQDYNSLFVTTISGRIDQKNTFHLGFRQLNEDVLTNKSFDLGYARLLNERWSMGIAAHYMQAVLPGLSLKALSVDLSVGYTLPLENLGVGSSLRAGARLGNLGGYISQFDEAMPMNIAAGVALDAFMSDSHEITIATDLEYYFDPSAARGAYFSIGAEYNLMQLIQLRIGYHNGVKDYSPNYISVGAGVRFFGLHFDGAYLITNKESPMHNVYSISVGLDF